jgi:Ca2+-binding RTX toxin-like protein
VTASAGDDYYSSGGGTFDLLFYDSASFSAALRGPVFVDLSLGLASGGGAGFDHLAGIWDGLLGSDFGDTLIGDARSNEITGLGGNDHIEGRAGNDALNGGEGSDLLDGGDGTDNCFAGETVLNCEP